MTPEEKSDAAKHLLESPIFKAAFKDVRENLVSQLEMTEIGDVDTHHEVALTLQLLKRLQAQITRYVDDATMAKHKRKQDSFIERLRERVA